MLINVWHDAREVVNEVNGWQVIENGELSYDSDEDGFWLKNMGMFPHGETIVFQIKGIMQYDYNYDDHFCADVSVSAEEYDYYAYAHCPELLEFESDYENEEWYKAKRGEKVTINYRIKNLLNIPIEDMSIWFDKGFSCNSDYDALEETFLIEVSENITRLAPGEEKELKVTFVVPDNMISSRFSFVCGVDAFDEDFDSFLTLNYSWIDFKIDGGTLNPFSDVQTGDWFYPYCMNVYENGFMTGLNETTFGATVGLSRAQFATILYRLEGEPETEGLGNPFPDVPSGQFYTDAAIWAANNGIITGYENGKFGPNDMITREQMATILYRFLINAWGWSDDEFEFNVDEVLGKFPDAANVSGFAKKGMAWAIDWEIITGDGGKINPQGTANRAHCATIISRFWGM